jgi:valyl-tRNA synthetase
LSLGVRRIKAELDIAPGKPVPILLQDASESDIARLMAHRASIDFIARAESVFVLEPGSEAPESAMALVGEMKILIPLAGLIDKDAELARLDKEIAKVEANLNRLEGKLGNATIVDVSKLNQDGRVVFGTTVELMDLDTEEKVVYQIVGTDEADIKQGKISFGSPMRAR